jgi:hypothetical protein
MLSYSTSMSIEIKRRVRPVNRNVRKYHKGSKQIFSIPNRLVLFDIQVFTLSVCKY